MTMQAATMRETLASIASADTRETQDVGIICGMCLDTLDPDGTCGNVGNCTAANVAATRSSLRKGSASAARPSAWTISGRVD